VLRAGLKIAGILCEAEIRDGRLEWALAGIGINLAGDLDDSLREIATTAHTGVDPLEVLAQIFARLHERCDEIGLGRVRDVLDAWSRHSATLGNNVRFTSAGRTIEGIAEFIDPHGALVIRAADGRRHTCIAGQLRHLG
jgi:BirA family biotin operon repressor/biotin-[acetyl-CoA-carboxylase] ligase